MQNENRERKKDFLKKKGKYEQKNDDEVEKEQWKKGKK